MDQILDEIQKLNFKSVSWIYLKKNNDYEKQISKSKVDIIWTPSSAAANIAKKTLFGDGVDRNRVILVSLGKELIGLYDITSPVMPSIEVKLKIYLDFKNKNCVIPKGSPAGSYLSKVELIDLYTGAAQK